MTTMGVLISSETMLLFVFRYLWKELGDSKFSDLFTELPEELGDSNFQIFSQNCQFHLRRLGSLEHFNVFFFQYHSEHYGLRDYLKVKSISVTATNHVKVITDELPDVVVHSVYKPPSEQFVLPPLGQRPSTDCKLIFQQPQHHMGLRRHR